MSRILSDPELRRGVESETVAEFTVPDNTVPQFIEEKVRFWWHACGITGTGLLAIALPRVMSGVWITAILGFFISLFAWYEILRARPMLQERLRTWILWPFTSWMVWMARKIKVRPHEVGTRASSMDFLVGLGLVWALFPEHVATACFVTAWCDPLARVVGRGWGKTRWWFSKKKTILGSSACWLVASLVAFLSLNCLYESTMSYTIFASVVIGFVAWIFEVIPQWPKDPKPGDAMTLADNFLIIVATAAMLEVFF